MKYWETQEVSHGSEQVTIQGEIFSRNPNAHKHWLSKSQLPQSVANHGCFEHKVILCVWWKYEGIIHYDLVQDGRTIEQLEQKYAIVPESSQENSYFYRQVTLNRTPSGITTDRTAQIAEGSEHLKTFQPLKTSSQSLLDPVLQIHEGDGVTCV